MGCSDHLSRPMRDEDMAKARNQIRQSGRVWHTCMKTCNSLLQKAGEIFVPAQDFQALSAVDLSWLE
jgi:hypothetical protein